MWAGWGPGVGAGPAAGAQGSGDSGFRGLQDSDPGFSGSAEFMGCGEVSGVGGGAHALCALRAPQRPSPMHWLSTQCLSKVKVNVIRPETPWIK